MRQSFDEAIAANRATEYQILKWQSST